VHEQEAALLEGEREHFGFRDGFAQPDIRDPVAGPNPRRGGGTARRLGRWRQIEPGEFVLGYHDEDGGFPDEPEEPLGRNGSYMVVRKLHQDVALFARALREATRGDADRERALAAKVVGRWPDGTPLARSPDRPMPDIFKRPDQINDFRYHHDPRGLDCPLGAHIRRANPRDAFGWQGRLTKRQRIIRRGMPYGPRLADTRHDDGRERGLMFICYQASISRQFEVVQSLWCNDGEPFGLGVDRDFLLGADPPEGKMTVPGHPPVFLHPLRSFVTTRGGDYFFVPGLRALRALAAGVD
jgi:Dyp-type peroxidase family